MISFRDQLHPNWQRELEPHLELLDLIEHKVTHLNHLPSHDQVMRALGSDPKQARVLILGQDPYPNQENATGLAFSIDKGSKQIPASLRNIFIELASDLNIELSGSGDLSKWSDQGVVLLNRTLTCEPNRSDSHTNLGWELFTSACVKVLAGQGVIPILWGQQANKFAEFFSPELVINSAHPSPLSAYRGFFGSKPFSRANALLAKRGVAAIDWRI